MRHWNRERRRATARSGFSLVELVAALVIFSGGVLAVLEGTAVCLRSTAASLGYTQAVHLAQRVIEETVAEGGIEVSSERGDFGESYPRHAWQREIEETDQDDLYQLHIENKQMKKEVKSLKAQIGNIYKFVHENLDPVLDTFTALVETPEGMAALDKIPGVKASRKRKIEETLEKENKN